MKESFAMNEYCRGCLLTFQYCTCERDNCEKIKQKIYVVVVSYAGTSWVGKATLNKDKAVFALKYYLSNGLFAYIDEHTDD